MPITFSHPAAVVPLLGVGLVPSALVIGSITPDLPYYLPGPLTSARTHAASGIVTFDLVLGLLAFLVWHVLLAPTAVALAPAALRERLAPGLPVPAREYVRRWWLVLAAHPGAPARTGLGAARGAGLRRAGGGEWRDRRRGRPAHR